MSAALRNFRIDQTVGRQGRLAGTGPLPLGVAQHADEYRSERPILLAVDQKPRLPILGERIDESRSRGVAVSGPLPWGGRCPRGVRLVPALLHLASVTSREVQR
jgi:hypothetical protein